MASPDVEVVPVEPEIERLQRLLADGDPDAAYRGAELLLETWPENRDLLLVAATGLRLAQRPLDALELLDRFALAHPHYSRMLQERGLCFVALKDAPQATDALLRAVNANPALPMSWRMLASLYRMSGDADNAAVAVAHVATLAALPAEIVTATALFADGDLGPAERIVRGYLIRHGDHVEAMRLLARIGMASDVLDDAELLLGEVIQRAPDYRAARLDYAQCLVERHKFERAQEQVDRLLAEHGPNRELRLLTATIAIGLGRQEVAIDLYRDLLVSEPASADLQLWLGHALKTIGQLPEAIGAYHAAASARPDFGDAYWSLANLKSYRFDDAEIARMRGAEAAPATAATDRIHLCFALGKALEDRGEIADSWLLYARGNALQRADSRYRPEVLETNTSEQRRICTATFFERRRGWGAPAADPIFIVGLPRSGSTLIEQILASHPLVEGTQELADVQRIVLELQGRDVDLSHPRYPAALADLTAQQFAQMGERYLADTRAYRTGAPFFIDKMPNNFRHLGLIHLMLPNARIIDARREPMACCFSNLKQLFAFGQEFTYGIDDIARYYRTYLELMRHWDAVLPGRVLRVQHEDVVDDLDASVRRILDHCGLPFDPACLHFHATRRSVRTPSSEQVRQPIFREGIDQWRKYAHWLEPLRDALGDSVEHYRD